MPARAFLAADLRFWDVDRALDGVIVQTHARLHAGTNVDARDDHAVVVEHFHPVVVHETDFFRVLVVDPDRVHAARECQHAVVVLVGRVDIPLAVRRDVVQHQALVVHRAVDDVARRARIQFRLEGGQVFAKVQIPRMVNIEVLASRQRAPGDEALDAHAPGGVSAPVVDHARPAGADQRAADLSSQIEEGHLDAAYFLSQVCQRETDAFLFVFERLVGDFAVRFGSQMQKHVGGIQRVFETGIFLPAPLHTARATRVGRPADGFLQQFIVEFLDGNLHAVAVDAIRAQVGSERDEAVVQVGVVALDHAQVRHGLARDGFAFARAPVLYVGLAEFVGRVVHERERHNVAHGFGEDFGRHFADLASQQFEDFPVGLGFPNGGNRLSERMHVRVQVGGVKIVLFVPERGGHDDVGIQRRGVHAEVQVNHQIHLAARHRLAEGDGLDLVLGVFLRNDIIVRAEIVTLEELRALGAGCQRIAAPHHPDTRPVLLRVWIVHREAGLSVFELVHHLTDDLIVVFRASRIRLLDEFEGVFIELWV